MRRKFLLVALCGLLSACAPQNQVSLLNDKKQEMGDIIDSCEEATKNADKPHTACAICTFDAWSVLLKEAGFKDMDLLESYRNHMIVIAATWDEKKITDKKAAGYFQDAKNQFTYSVQRRDAERKQRFVGAMLAISDGLNSAPRYTPAPMPSYAPVSQPSMPPIMSAPASFSPTTLMNSYNQPPPAPMGMGQGARGYDGITGQVDRTYIPAGADPNPPPNVTGQ